MIRSTMPASFVLSRRSVAAGLAATIVGPSGVIGAQPAALAQAPAPNAPEGWRVLSAAPIKRRLRPEPAQEVELWAFDGAVPGPVIRIRHGEELRLRLHNDLERPLSLHWHGVRNASAMDGVGGFSQEPVGPKQSFEYRFTPPDAGTFLIRPLVIGASSELAERGLSAILIVEEREPPAVDHELALVVDDWRLSEDGSLAPFGAPLDAATAGRLGNWVTVNAKDAPERLSLPPGSRVRLRLANACNARTLRIRFDDLKLYVIAVDGQPTDTFEPLRSTLPFSPGSRYDLLLDMPAEPGPEGKVVALLGEGVPLVALTVAGEAPKRPALPPIAALPSNKLLAPAIRLQDSLRRDVTIAGGARRGPEGKAVFEGDPKRIWTMNGAPGSTASKPVFSAKRGSPVVLTVINQTPLVQPVHLHGHAFRLLHPFDDGWEPYWIDTLQVPEGRTVRIAFVADNPGRWLLSSSVLERFDTGLWSWFEVT